MLRATVFLAANYDAAGTIWRDLTGTEPDIEEARPREGFRRHAGAFNDGILEVQMTPQRLDITLTPKADGAEQRTEIGDYKDAKRAFDGVVVPWLDRSRPPTFRIAHYVIALLPAADRIEAYRLLDDLIPSVDVQPEETSDFFYAINRPAKSRVVPNLKINRITRWSAMLTRRL